MTREPDRFEEKAEAMLFDMGLNVEMVQFEGDRDRLAAALRQTADEALERAAQLCMTEPETFHTGFYFANGIRALASPAAAPAAVPCRAECASRMPDYSHYECTLPKGHVGPHKEGSFAEWTDATTVVAPSLLPRVLAALETQPFEHGTALAAELRRYIAEMEAGHAEAPDAERDRNRHNAMLVEAWREEFGTLCKVLFPGNDGPIGWKHIHAKIAEREKRIAELEAALRALTSVNRAVSEVEGLAAARNEGEGKPR